VLVDGIEAGGSAGEITNQSVPANQDELVNFFY
jgi:hypothetical protein